MQRFARVDGRLRLCLAALPLKIRHVVLESQHPCEVFRDRIIVGVLFAKQFVEVRVMIMTRIFFVLLGGFLFLFCLLTRLIG